MARGSACAYILLLAKPQNEEEAKETEWHALMLMCTLVGPRKRVPKGLRFGISESKTTDDSKIVMSSKKKVVTPY